MKDLLERDRELGSVEELIDEAVAGEGRVILLEGPAGIGKTRLLAEARRLGQSVGMQVLSARSSELEREFPYGVVRQLFEPLLVDPAARGELLGGAAASAGVVFGNPGDGEADSADASFAILHGLYWLTVNLSGQAPLLLAVDDLHWCDRPSLRFLAFLLRRLEGLPLAIACTLRDAEPGTDPTLLGELVHDQATRPIRPVPLSEEAVHELVCEQLDEAAEATFSTACHQAVGGNPLLLRQLLRALESEGYAPTALNAGVVTDVGPRAVSRTVLVRLSRLSDEAVRVARGAAVLGDGAELPALAQQAEVAEDAAAAAIGELARTEILRSEPPISFVHPLVREAIYQDLPAGERELQHERAARALAAEAPPEQVATHLLQVPRRGEAWVVETLRAAAGSAVAKGAAESAVSYLRRALEEPPSDQLRPRVLFELGSAEALTSGMGAIDYLREAREGLDDAASRAIAANVLTRNLMIAASPAAATEVAREAAAELPPELAHLRGAFESLAFAAVFFGVGDFSTLAELEEMRPPPVDAAVGEKLVAAMAAYWWTYRCRPAAECAEMSLAALSGEYELFGTDNSIVSIGAIMPLVYADREEALAAWDASARTAHRRGSTFDISGVHLWRGATMLQRGELIDAEADLRAAVEDQRVFGSAEIARSYTAGLLATTLLERGDRGAAAEALAAGDDPSATGTDGRRFWLEARLKLLLAEDRHDEAVAVAERLRDDCTWALNPALAHWRSGMARALDRLERRDEAVALLEEELELARGYGAPGTVGRVLRELGAMEREAGESRLDEALEVLEGSPARLELAKAQAAKGSAMRLSRRPKEAREPLRRALELSESCGAGSLEAHVRAELAAAGVRPRATALSGVESLTASERRVASLAAAGGTNRDIAQELFVTPKTVEVHLSNTYRKLGIRSRRELPRSLAPA